jgi:hypothetical protein
MPVTQTLPDVASLPSKVRRSTEKIWLPVWRAWNGDPAVNAAGLLPVMPIYEPVSLAIYHITKFKTYSDSEFKNELNALNSDTWKSFTANQCWISEIHTNGTETKGSSTGEDVHYVVRCIDRTDGWKAIIPNTGYTYKDGTSLKSFISATGQPYIGNLVTSTGAGTAGTTMNIIALSTKKTIAFSSIGGF